MVHTAVNLNNLAPSERIALGVMQTYHEVGRATSWDELVGLFASPDEAHTRLGFLVKLGLARKVRGGFRPTEVAQQAMNDAAEAIQSRHRGVMRAQGAQRASHPKSFLILQGDKLVDHDPDLIKLSERVRQHPRPDLLTIISPLSG